MTTCESTPHSRATRGLALLAAVLALCWSAQPATAQTWPEKPIRLVVPSPPGGGTDALSRLVAGKLGELNKWQMVVDNRAGAGGTIGVDLAAKAAPDGYTILMGYFAPIGVNPSLYKLPYDPVHDFAGVTLVATSQNLLAVHPSVPAKTVKEFIALLRSKPGQLTYGSGGMGSAMHVSAELFNMMAKVSMVHVPYKGAGPVANDLVGGQINLAFVSVPSSLPFVKSGRVRAIAVAGTKRSVALPDVPTVDESGLPGFESSQWYGVMAPIKTPRVIIDKLHQDFNEAMNVPDIKAQLIARGFELVGSTPTEFDQFIKNEIVKWAKVIKAAGIRGE